jgi:uncharacterized protein
MAVSLYEVSVGTYRQILGGVVGVLDKGRQHCQESGIELPDLVETSLYPDMLPLRFQLLSVVHHSLGAIDGVKAGVFSPPQQNPDVDYDGLQQLVVDASASLGALTADEVNGLEGNDMEFRMGDFSMPFTAEGFLLSFSLPNFYFHATTTYDILRSKGVPVGKRDFMGQPKLRA